MAYTPYYPGYQPQYYQPPMMDNLGQLRQQQYQTPQAAPPQNPMIWVQGEAAARAYLVANGNTVPLWDSENPVVYIKTVDASGMPSMRILDYTERAAAAKTAPAATQAQDAEYVKRADYDALAARVEALEAEKRSVQKGKEEPKNE